MKKSTGILFLVALALGAFVYYYEFKRTPPTTPAEVQKSAFNNVAEGDITKIVLTRGGMMAVFEKKDGEWYMTAPMMQRADQALVDGIATELAFTKIDRTFPAGTASLDSYGLGMPAVILDFTAKGMMHKLQLGSKDFDGASVYALVDDSKDIDFVANTILTVSDKAPEDLRDHAVLDLSVRDAVSFDLMNSSGEVTGTKMGDDWKIEKPRAVAADSTAVGSLLDAISSARITHFDSEKGGNLAQYGLAKPAITFTAKLSDGKSSSLQIGKKEGDDYYARDTSRPLIFRVNANLLMALNQKFFDLRNKQIVNFARGEVTRLDVHNQNGNTSCVATPDGDLVIDPGAGKKTDNAPPCPDFVPQLESAMVTDVMDEPPAAITGKLASPAVEMTITDKSGSKTTIRVSAVSDNAVYAQSSVGPQVYKLDPAVFDSLNAKPQ